VRRDAVGNMSATPVVLPPNLKLKIFRDGFRTRFCEALLARRVLVVEGKTEFVAYSAVSRRAAEIAPAAHKRLDSLGWVPFDAVGDTAVAPFATFFRGLGKTVATIFDQQLPAAKAAIEQASDRAFEQPYSGFEALLQAEVSAAMQSWFVKWLAAQDEWPQALQNRLPPDNSPDQAYAAPFFEILRLKKGNDYLTLFFDQCEIGHFPPTIMWILGELTVMVEPPPAPPPQPLPLPPLPVPVI